MRCTRILAVLPLVGTLFLPVPSLAQQPTIEGYPAPGAPPIITVTDLGAEPRVLLRFKVSSGQRTGMLMTTNTSLTTQVGDRTQTARIPAVTMTGNVTVTGVSADGDISYSLRMTEMKVDAAGGADPGVLAALQNFAALFSKVSAVATMSSRGVHREFRWDLNEIPDTQVREQMSQSLASWTDSMVPWPEDAVGVGARWSVRQTATKHGTALFIAVDYQVVSIHGSGVTVVLTTKGTAPKQVVPATNGMSMSMTCSGSGRMTMPLDSLVPTSEGRATMVAEMSTQPDLPDSLRVTTESEVAITPTTPVASPDPEPTPAGAITGSTAQPVAKPGDSGVTTPQPEREVKPNYSPEAKQAGVQGEVRLECVVLPDGTVGEVIVVRSLRPDLDANAIAAAKRWRFRPGTRNGEPVAVLVTISMSFTLK